MQARQTLVRGVEETGHEKKSGHDLAKRLYLLDRVHWKRVSRAVLRTPSSPTTDPIVSGIADVDLATTKVEVVNEEDDALRLKPRYVQGTPVAFRYYGVLCYCESSKLSKGQFWSLLCLSLIVAKFYEIVE